MSFKQRERRRKKRAAQLAAQKQARRTGTSTGKWWRTIVTRTTCCARCAGVLREGRQMVYRARPREALCVACADADATISSRPSLRWEHQRVRQRSG